MGNFTSILQPCSCHNDLLVIHVCLPEPQDGVQPWFITKLKPTTAYLGQNVLLSCAIAGDPFPQWSWMKQGQVVNTDLDYEILQKEDVVSLLIRRVRSHHAGDYEISLR